MVYIENKSKKILLYEKNNKNGKLHGEQLMCFGNGAIKSINNYLNGEYHLKQYEYYLDEKSSLRKII